MWAVEFIAVCLESNSSCNNLPIHINDNFRDVLLRMIPYIVKFSVRQCPFIQKKKVSHKSISNILEKKHYFSPLTPIKIFKKMLGLKYRKNIYITHIIFSTKEQMITTKTNAIKLYNNTHHPCSLKSEHKQIYKSYILTTIR